MANARDVVISTKHRILMLGNTGSGKTTQLLTLPGKKYVHIFDQNALLSLRGHDIDFDEYMPDPVGMAATSMSEKPKGGPSDKSRAAPSTAYKLFEEQFNERMQNGFFDQYDWVCFDGATTLLDLIMDRVLSINGRYGTWPHQDDHGPVMIAFTNICRNLTAMGKGVYMTGHLETRQDQVTKKIETRPMMTGRLVVKIPLLFSDIFVARTSVDQNGKLNYLMQTTPDDTVQSVRCSIKGLNPVENISIDFAKDPVGQGLGGILNWETKQLQGV